MTTLPSATPRVYRIVWNGEEYVATASGYEATGHSRHPGSAFVALANKLLEMGVEIVAPSPPQPCHHPDCDEMPIEDSDFCANHQD